MTEAMGNWSSRVAFLAERLAEEGLDRDDVSAIAAGLDDVSGGLETLLDLLEDAVGAHDRDSLAYAKVEVDYHLRPHLKALSKALDSYDRLSRRTRKRARRTG